MPGLSVDVQGHGNFPSEFRVMIMWGYCSSNAEIPRTCFLNLRILLWDSCCFLKLDDWIILSLISFKFTGLFGWDFLRCIFSTPNDFKVWSQNGHGNGLLGFGLGSLRFLGSGAGSGLWISL